MAGKHAELGNHAEAAVHGARGRSWWPSTRAVGGQPPPACGLRFLPGEWRGWGSWAGGSAYVWVKDQALSPPPTPEHLVQRAGGVRHLRLIILSPDEEGFCSGEALHGDGAGGAAEQAAVYFTMVRPRARGSAVLRSGPHTCPGDSRWSCWEDAFWAGDLSGRIWVSLKLLSPAFLPLKLLVHG